MVQLMKSGELHKGKMVKREVDDVLEEDYSSLNKRSKQSSSIHLQNVGLDIGTGGMSVPQQYNPLEEPSPLGLKLRKSPSLLELIQMRISQANSPKSASTSKKDQKGTGSSGTSEKLKASNFPASILRIGTWEYKSRYEGDLVAKCYFAKHKLVWEVLDGGLKNKIEIQWSDIMALKARCPDDGPSTLDVVLARQPLFFRETNPQPRKHTLWQATSDFTGGQASIHRCHFLQCAQGLLGKHFEKLTQCDPRLNFLSQQGDITVENPYFEPRVSSVFDDPNGNKAGFDLNNDEGGSFFNLRETTSPSGGQSSSSRNEHDFVSLSQDSIRHETPSPSSVMDTHAIEEIKSNGEQWREPGNWDQIRVPGLHSSMSMSDLVSHLESRISEQKTSNNVVLSSEDRQGLEILDEISRCLFSDSQHVPASDEKSLMSRVNSLCCLLQKDPPTGPTSTSKNEGYSDASTMGKRTEDYGFAHIFTTGSKFEGKSNIVEGESDLSGSKQIPAMSRKDSVGDLLLNLPRITSLPQFLFNIAEDSEAR